jgi:sortase A
MSAILERALLVVGFACLGWYGLASADAAYTQRVTHEAVVDALEKARTGAADAEVAPRWPVIRPGREIGSRLVGLLEIPRLEFSTPVVEGDDNDALRGAAGHLPDTPRPWEQGNSAIAAHRDGIFRPLRKIRIGDELRVQTPHGELRYTVTGTQIVAPTDLSVLKPTSTQTLTLITCYPFDYIGSAPKRFIVRAQVVAGLQPRLRGTVVAGL